MTIRPDVPAAARLMEAARTLRLEAQALRRSFPPKRASSQTAEVDVDADGRTLALRLLDPRLLPASQWGGHLLELYRAATGTHAEGVAVSDLGPGEVPSETTGLGPGRFQFPPGIDADAPPAVVLSQANARLRTRFAAAEAASGRISELDGHGTAGGDDEVVVRVGSLGQLLEVRISSHLGSRSQDEVNELLAEALQAARGDLRAQVDALLTQEGI
ncbi:hypothetical protein GCM10028820_09100 [Tessaracoccus terricola]